MQSIASDDTWSEVDEAAEQGDEADEAGASDRASQLISGVGRTLLKERRTA